MSTTKLADCLNGHEPMLNRKKDAKTGRIIYQERCDCTGGPNKYSIPEAENGWNAFIRKLVERAIPKEAK